MLCCQADNVAPLAVSRGVPEQARLTAAKLEKHSVRCVIRVRFMGGGALVTPRHGHTLRRVHSIII